MMECQPDMPSSQFDSGPPGKFDTYSLHGFTDSELCQACGDKQKQISGGVLVTINNSPL